MSNARTSAEWIALDRAAKAAGFYQLVMGAEENADTTVYAEKAAPVEEHAELCFGSLEMSLACCEDEAALAWFKAQGIRW